MEQIAKKEIVMPFDVMSIAMRVFRILQQPNNELAPGNPTE